MQLAKLFDTAEEFLNKYGMAPENIGEQREELLLSGAMVPVFGSYATGKSTLLNTLAGRRVLATGAQETAMPVELSYGPNRALALRDGRWQTMGIGDFAEGFFDLSGVSRVRVQCVSEGLAEFPELCLVDLPGMDSVGQDSVGRFADAAARDCLKNACCVLLVFSAEDPVMKRSLSDFLLTCDLERLPVCAVVTKCDKVPAAAAQRAAAYLREELDRLLGLQELCVVTAAAGFEKDVTGPAEFLARMQNRVGQLRARRCAEVMERPLKQLERYLELRLAGERLTASELARRLEKLYARRDFIRERMQSEQGSMQRQAEALEQQVSARLAAEVQARAVQIVELMVDSQNPAPYFAHMLRLRVGALAQNEWRGLWCDYTHGLVISLHAGSMAERASRTDSGMDEEMLENFEQTADAQMNAIRERFVATLPDYEAMFETELNGELYGSRHEAAARAVVQERLIPAICDDLSEKMPAARRALFTEFQAQLDGILDAATEVQRKAIRQTEQALQQDDARRSQRREALERDLDALRELMAALDSRKDEREEG